MSPVESTRKVKSKDLLIKNTLLVVGPQPPPIGGATISVQTLLDELAEYPKIQTRTINISPRKYNKKTSLINFEMISRAVTILRLYVKNIRCSDAVLVIATKTFIFALGYLLLLLARRHHVSLFLKPLGGDLGLGSGVQNRLLLSYKLRILRGASGVFAQTRQLQTELNKLCSTNTHYVPGYRSVPLNIESSKKPSKELRLVFLSLIERGKGPFLLMEAIRLLARKESVRLVCDFYGPILENDSNEFFTNLKATPNARYCGIHDGGAASNLLAKYDVLVFPTYHLGEGHPGVIIEAMQAGIPVISTRFRASAELITDGENGFLIPVGNSLALSSAIKRFLMDPSLRERMGKANFQRGQEFSSDLVVSRMLEIMLPGTAISLRATKTISD